MTNTTFNVINSSESRHNQMRGIGSESLRVSQLNSGSKISPLRGPRSNFNDAGFNRQEEYTLGRGRDES